MSCMFHFTCDHGAEGIKATGMVRPNRHLWFDVPIAWFTDLDEPDAEAVGLTSTLLVCDRLRHRFEVDPNRVALWKASALRAKNPIGVMDLERYGQPDRWFISLTPVPVVEP